MSAPPPSPRAGDGRAGIVASVSVRSLVKRFGADAAAVNGVSFTVREGEFVTLLGPSGCGKTTTLRCIAGLEVPEGGEILIGDELLTSAGRGVCLPPEQRRLGMVFQSYAVWPHMTVFENVAYGLRAQSVARAEVGERVTKALELVGLSGLQDRNATKLSGGQQQRVAVARALVYNPRVLLFDEPLSNLDAKLREQMRLELTRLVRELGITSIYVTHDQAEAMVMSDRIIVMHEGRIQQEGVPQAIYDEPASRFVADFIGVTNLLEGTAAGRGGEGGVWVEVPEAGARLLCGRRAEEVEPGERVTVSIRPEHISIEGAPAGPNRVEGTLTEAIYLGQSWDCRVRVKDVSLRVQAQGEVSLRPGQQVALGVLPRRCVLLRG
ncbi:MAG: ABC transporter ATP-binding protein [Candidatus Tectomicrobia bacterium]|uniref:ABC transporter ATP-binding protein n=1 Tax=Tectimicrobiota bacterium TaxID=2528274 RepID=A0A932ZV40_UNCTE|nr:ABC transporter ATP-binding protein [Candidatus Tectomicrobia bacterium]